MIASAKIHSLKTGFCDSSLWSFDWVENMPKYAKCVGTLRDMLWPFIEHFAVAPFSVKHGRRNAKCPHALLHAAKWTCQNVRARASFSSRGPVKMAKPVHSHTCRRLAQRRYQSPASLASLAQGQIATFFTKTLSWFRLQAVMVPAVAVQVAFSYIQRLGTRRLN